MSAFTLGHRRSWATASGPPSLLLRSLALLLAIMPFVLLIRPSSGVSSMFAQAAMTGTNPKNNKNIRRQQQPSQERFLQKFQNTWGIQTGPANGNSDAGGMVYDYENDHLLLVGTTYDTEYFTSPTSDGNDPNNNNNNHNVDCFFVSVRLPPISDELSEQQAAGNEELATLAAQERQNFTSSGQARMVSSSLDRCDLVVRVSGEGGGHHDHVFVGGTVAMETSNSNEFNSVPTSVEPLIMEAHVEYFQDSQDHSKIETGMPMHLFTENTADNPASGVSIKKNDLIIPAAMASYDHHLYIATIKRKLVVTQASSSAEPMLQIVLVLSRFETADGGSSSAALALSWTREYETEYLEVRGDGNAPHVTSSMFHDRPGPTANPNGDNTQDEIEQELEELENEEEAYEEEVEPAAYRHEYRFDGVLISAIEVLDTSDHDEAYMLVAGSAPGTVSTLNTTTEHHPLMDDSKTFVGDWDGYVTKVSSRTGEVLRPADYNSPQHYEGYDTWTYRVESQPKRNDFVQSICVPHLPHDKLSTITHEPSVVFVVGTTQGKVAGTQDGGAFVLALSLDTLNVLWKKQIPGMNVHGLACAAYADPATVGFPETSSNDVLYVAGEVHGSMEVEVHDPTSSSGTSTYKTTGNGETDVWVAQFQAYNGRINWVKQIGTEVQDRLAKNTNNPVSDATVNEDNIGDSGSGKGALVLDRSGHAIIYGTTQGSLCREKEQGNRFKDIFVLRLHKDDGTYQSVLPGSDSGSIHNDPGRESPDGTVKDPTANSNDRHSPSNSAGSRRSINYTAVVLGIVLPVVLTIIIILATSKRRPGIPDHGAESA